MFTSFKVNGTSGTIRWGYMAAVTFGPWSYKGEGTTGTLHAQIVSVDEYRVARTPLVAEVPMGRAVWRWHVVGLQISGSTLTAQLERREE